MTMPDESPPFLTIADVKERVQRIREVQDDDEVAHDEEDELYEDVLRSIAYNAYNAFNAPQLAREALKTKEIKFARWTS